MDATHVSELHPRHAALLLLVVFLRPVSEVTAQSRGELPDLSDHKLCLESRLRRVPGVS